MDERVEPVDGRNERHQHQVEAVQAPGVYAFVEQYFRMLLNVAAAYRYVVEETERGEIAFDGVDYVPSLP